MPKSPKELMEDERLERDAEFLELVSFSKEIYRDNLRLVGENKDLKAEKRTSKAAEWLFDRRYGLERVWILFLCILSLFGALGLIALICTAAVGHKTTGHYYTRQCTEKFFRGALIMQEIDWDMDIPASECLDDPNEVVRLVRELNSHANDH